MAIPARTRTYAFNVNQTFRSTGVALSDAQRLMRALKNSLKALGASAWTVRYSCDSSVAGTVGDGVDRWSADAALVWGATARSWIVLRQTGSGANFEVCIDLNSATTTNATIVVSFATSFSGGSTTARPTAVDEKVLISAAAWHSIPASTNHQLHIMVGDDGKVTKFFFTATNVVRGYVDLSVAEGVISQWLNPWVASWLSSSPIADNYFAATNVWGVHSTTSLALYVGNQAYGGVICNDFDVG